ncbi:hypothetical protein ACH5RR_034792 [Cinchona calisaya]|uniref:Leucine-rich repeat-containing N-terminal plant-type domain-containing protein n=1 Tax=Cinchona calisaya TaxID=153742 RepID=A0ABD2YBY9_9GENT
MLKLANYVGSDKETQAMEESSKHKNVMDTMYCFPNRTSGIEIPTPIDAAAGMIGDACFIAGVENVAIGQGYKNEIVVSRNSIVCSAGMQIAKLTVTGKMSLKKVSQGNISSLMDRVYVSLKNLVCGDRIHFLSSNGATKEEERVALLQLRDSLNRPNGSALVNEWVGNDYCDWDGIRCDRNLLVHNIVLPSIRQLGLGIWYPNATLLSHFENLEYLYLSDNNIGSWIMPEALRRMSNLKELDLSSNPLNGDIIPQIRCLPSLEELYLSTIYPSHAFIPALSGICRLQKLKTLNLSDNLIQGGIHPCLSKMTSLVSLDLSFNHFQGNLPSFIFSNLTSLIALYISHNKFDGTLSFATFANLSNLRYIDLSNNDLMVNTESPSWFPSFQLMFLSLRNCHLNKDQGRVVPSFISYHTSIFEISLDYNALQGALPSWLLYNTTLLGLSLRGNSFSGGIQLSSGFATSWLQMLDISDNRLSGQLSSTIGNSFPELRYLNTSSNAFKGEIPSSYGNLTKLEVLDLSNNFLQGRIPINLRQNHTSLAQLILSGNNFHETMPSFSNMSNLACLHLRNVGFGGSITRSLVNLPVLEVLDISWNNLSVSIPDWFHTMPNLAIILLSRNQFHDTIPISLCQIQKLHFLDLSANSLSGVIPTCLNNITSWKKESELLLPYFTWIIALYADYRVKVPLTTKGNSLVYEGTPLSFMTGLDLSMNQLTGEIPSQLGELTALHSLNLSFNILTGHIPKSFSIMEKVESLDLSHNNLVGSIPREIVQLHFIATLNVSFNNLSGSIPFLNNFRTFDESSYRGNKGLCGLPLDTACTSPNNKPPQKDEEEERAGIAESDFFFFSCIAVSYVVGFWAVILPLVVSKNWRRKHYAVVDSCIYICCNKFSGFLTRIKDCCGTWNTKILTIN